MSSGSETAAAQNAPLGIVCGGGGFPLQVAERAVRSGRRVLMLGIEGLAERSIERFPHVWFRLIELRRLSEVLRDAGCREICIIGHIVRPPLASLTLDRDALRLLPRLAQLYRGGDDRLLAGVAGLIEEVLGLKVVGAHEVAPDMLVPAGPLGRHQPSAEDRADIEYAFDVLAALGPFDVGQGAIVAHRHVLAIEAAEGTDRMIERVAALRTQRRLHVPVGAGVLVKAPKRMQDRRVDLPAIGPRTVENVIAAGLAGIAVVAQGAIIAETDQVRAAADAGKIFVIGVPGDTRGMSA